MSPQRGRSEERDGSDGVPAPLRDTLESMRAEIDGLRASMQLRAIIEQAKGILVERHGLSLDEAFAHLRRTSQEHNVRLVEVAATIVGIAVPRSESQALADVDSALRDHLPQSSAPSATWSALQRQPDVRDGVLSALLDSVAGSTTDGDEAARLLVDMLAPHRVAGAVLYRTAIDGSLRCVGHTGVPGDLMSSWRSVPPSLDVPFVRAVVEDRAYFWSDRADRTESFPAVSGVTAGFEATAAIPLHQDDEVQGVVGLMWAGPESFPDEDRQRIVALVERVGGLLLRHVATSEPELDWLKALLQLIFDPWILLDAVVSGDGSVRDLVVQDVAVQVEPGSEWLGRRVLEVWPALASDGTVSALVGLVRSGGSWTTTVGIGSDAPWATPGSRVRAVRLGHRVVVVWRPRGT